MFFSQVLKNFVLSFLLLGFSSFAIALQIPTPQAYVNDYANLIDDTKQQVLESELLRFEEQTSNQIMVATFVSLEGESLEDFSHRLATQWKVGQKLKNNGVVLLVFSKDRQLRIEVGYGLEGVLPDALAKRIIQNDIVPHFKNQDYTGGIFAGLQSIKAATQGEYKGSGPKSTSKKLPSLGTIIFFMILFFVLGRRGIVLSPGGWGGGRGGWGSSGGGFSGGGGGSFGGGGASGRW